MYALKAREKLHKREKDEQKERRKDGQVRARDSRGETTHDSGHADRRQPATTSREAKYVGTFSVEMKPSWKSDIGKAVKHHLSKVNIKDSSSCQLPVSILVNMEGIKVLSEDGRDLIMAHALRHILYCTVDGKKHLFAMVSRNSDTGTDGIYSHIFYTAKKDQANELNDLVGKAFKASFTKQTLKKMKKNRILPDTPWTVTATDTSNSTPPASQHSSALNPSAPPPIPPHSHQQTPPPSYSSCNSDQVLCEARKLEVDISRLSSRLREIEVQIREVASIEEAVIQLTVESSKHQQQLEEKQQRLLVLNQQLQTGSTASDPLPVPAQGAPLPDLTNISLEDVEWFQEGLPREIAMEILSYQPEGGFIVRHSSSSPGSYALSLKAPQDKIVHYLINNTPGGVQLQGSLQTFPSLVDLIHHHTISKESLPCTLNLDTSNPTFLDGNRTPARNSDSGSDDLDFTVHGRYHMMT